MTTAVKYVFTAYDKTQKSFDKINKNLAKLEKRAGKVHKNLQNVNKAFNDTLKTIAGVGLAIALPAKGLLSLAGSVAENNRQLEANAKMLGVSVDKANQYEMAAAGMGVEAAAFTGALVDLNKHALMASKGVSASLQKFNAIGISLRGADGAVRSSEELMGELADRIKSVKDPTQKLAIAEYVLGANAAKLLPMLSKGKDAMKAQMKAAEALTYTQSEYNREQMETFLIGKTLIGKIFGQMKGSLAAGLYPALNRLIKAFTKFYEKFKLIIHARLEKVFAGVAKWVDKLTNTFNNLTDTDVNSFFDKVEKFLSWIPYIIGAKVVLSVLSFIAALKSLSAALGITKLAGVALKVGMVALQTVLLVIKGVILLVKGAFFLLNLVMYANPIGLVIAAIVGLVAGFVLLWNKCEGFRNAIKAVWETMKGWGKAVADIFGGIAKWVGDAVSSFLEMLNPINAIKNAFSKIKGWFGGGDKKEVAVSEQVAHDVALEPMEKSTGGTQTVDITGNIGVTASGGAKVTESSMSANGVGLNMASAESN